MDATTTALAQSECCNAIETKVNDCGEWQVPTIYSGKFYEVCKHLSALPADLRHHLRRHVV